MTEKNPAQVTGKGKETNTKRQIVWIQIKKEKIPHGMDHLVVQRKENKKTFFWILFPYKGRVKFLLSFFLKMQILIKTPFYNHNKYLPHLLEHCVLHSEDKSTLLHLSDIYAYTSTGYTWFEREQIPTNEVIQLLQIPIKQKSFILQQKVIKNEFRSASFWQKFYEKILQKVFDKSLLTNSTASISFDELLHYQKTRYQLNNMLIIKDDWTIDQQQWKGKNLRLLTPKITEFHLPEYTCSSYQKERDHTLALKNMNPASVLILDFFWALCEDLCYLYDTKKGKYYSERFNYSFTDLGFLISREDNFPHLSQKTWKSFFDTFKQYYCEKIKTGAKRAFIPHIALFFDCFISKKDHKNLIDSINFPVITELAYMFKLFKQ